MPKLDDDNATSTSRHRQRQNTPQIRSAQDRLHILTYNLKTGLKNAPAKDVFMQELHGLHRFKYDIIGLCKTRATMKTRTKWNTTGDEIFIGPGHGQQHVGGVGFIVSNRIANQIIQVDIRSSRIGTLKLQLAPKKTLLVIQVYAPHSGYEAKDIEQFYEDVRDALEQSATHKMVIGDFNAQLGPRDNQRYMGEYAGNTWTETGERLADFAESQKLFIINTYFQKNPNKRWTFESTNVDKTRREIDYGLITDRHLVSNIEFISRFNIASDHRPIRFTLKLQMLVRRKKHVQKTRLFDPEMLRHAIEKSDWDLPKPLAEKFDIFHRQLKACVDAAATTKPKNPSRLSEETHQLLKKL